MRFWVTFFWVTLIFYPVRAAIYLVYTFLYFKKSVIRRYGFFGGEGKEPR